MFLFSSTLPPKKKIGEESRSDPRFRFRQHELHHGCNHSVPGWHCRPQQAIHTHGDQAAVTSVWCWCRWATGICYLVPWWVNRNRLDCRTQRSGPAIRPNLDSSPQRRWSKKWRRRASRSATCNLAAIGRQRRRPTARHVRCPLHVTGAHLTILISIFWQSFHTSTYSENHSHVSKILSLLYDGSG
jgi:hypothetical protein